MCGFPTGLAIEGLRSLDGAGNGDPDSRGPSGPTGLSPVRSKPAPTPPSAEEDLNAAISRDLRARMEVIQELGRGPDVTNELCEAALSEAEGRIAEALGTLRSAQSRLERETEEVLVQRGALLKERRDVLQKTGVRFSLAPDFERLNSAMETGDRGDAVGFLVDAERRVAQFESDWKGLQGLLSQIEGLRNEAAELGMPLGEISSELEGIRDRLVERELTEESLDTFAQEAAQTLMLLHEAIPSSLEEELARTETSLDRFPEEHSGSAVARRLHLEASRHLKKGRLSEAMQSLRELRRELEQLEKIPVAAPVPAEAPEDDDVMLDRLLKKARSLAGRVRTLPPDSETARDAAIQIREATDLLRARKLSEADLTLTRLMRMLASEPSGT
ncbi:MAG: hypothetical protein ABSB97_01960 [Thermoplasmata archaeon]